MKLLSPALVLLVGSLQAATLTYFPTEQTNAQTVNVSVLFETSAEGILGTVSVNPDASDQDIGDIRALFFNLVDLPAGLTPQSVLADISGVDITNTVLNNNTLGGQANVNPLPNFDIGLEFGSQGIGQDDIQLTTFLIANTDLTLANFGSVAVRVTSIGLPDGSREGSGKFLDDDGDFNDGGDPVVPEPSTYVLAGSALVAVAWARRRRA